MPWWIPLDAAAVGAVGQKKANDRNASAQERINARNIEEARRAERVNIAEARRAQNISIHEANNARWHAAHQANVARAQLLADRAEHRAYNDPAAVRARIEAAGFNPLAYQDGSGTPVTGSFAAPTEQAATVAPGSAVVPQLGASISTAFQGWGEAFTQASALSLQATELELQNRELTKQLERMTMRPRVPGRFERAKNANTRKSRLAGNYTDSRTTDSPYRGQTGQRPVPVRDHYNLYVDVYDSQTGRWIVVPNPDLMDAGPVESAYALAQLGAADAAQNGLRLGGAKPPKGGLSHPLNFQIGREAPTRPRAMMTRHHLKNSTARMRWRNYVRHSGHQVQ